MRASNPAITVDEIWDEVVTGHTTASTFAKLLKDTLDANMSTRAQQPVEYTHYSSIGAGASVAPSAGVIIHGACMVAVSSADDLQVLQQGIDSLRNAFSGESYKGLTASLYCDGTNMTFKNNDGSAHNISLFGVDVL